MVNIAMTLVARRSPVGVSKLADVVSCDAVDVEKEVAAARLFCKWNIE